MKILLLFFVILVSFIIIKDKKDYIIYNKVKKMKSIYYFSHVESEIIISKEVNNLQKFKNSNLGKMLVKDVEFNNYDIKNIMGKLLMNRYLLKKYNENFNILVSKIKINTHEFKILNLLSEKIELLFCIVNKIRPQIDVKIIYNVSYISPMGRNRYLKSRTYNYESLVSLMEEHNIFKQNFSLYNDKIANLEKNSKYDINVSKYNAFDNNTFHKLNTNSSDIGNVYKESETEKTTKEIAKSSNISTTNNIVQKQVVTFKKDKSLYLSSKEKMELNDELENICAKKLSTPIEIKFDNKETKIEIYRDWFYDYGCQKKKVILNYYKEKYINKERNNFKIIDLKYETMDLYYPLLSMECGVFFYCRCNKCNRVYKILANTFLKDSIKCECNLNFSNDDKKTIDIEWEKNLIPYSVIIRKTESLRYSYSVSLDKIDSYYLKNNDELKRVGISKIKEFNAYRKYLIGDYSVYFKNKYNVYNNVFYDIFDHNYNPIVYYRVGDKYLKLNKSEIQNFDFVFDIIFICLEKVKDSRDKFYIKVYHNKKLLFKIFNQYNLSGSCMVIDNRYFVFHNDYMVKVENLGVIIKGFTYDLIYNTFIYNDGITNIINNRNFYNTNTNIQINVNSKLISKKTSCILRKINYINNERYKRIFIQKSIYKENIVLFNYLKDNFELKILKNEFDDDLVANYFAIVDRNDKNSISFIEYVLSKSSSIFMKYGKYFYCRIYDHSINSIAKLLLSNINFRRYLIELLENSDLFIVEDDFRKRNIIELLKYYFNDFHDIDGTYMIILNKLKKKYDVDNLELFLILLKKYGEEVVFDLPDLTYELELKQNVELCDINDKKYNDILNTLEIPHIKWKSEYKLYTLIKLYFSDAIFQYKFQELGEQSLDIYIPCVKIAFEYQGQQHYNPVDFFGGEKKFLENQIRDERKKKICSKNDIILIEWQYNEKINKIVLDKKLYDYKNHLNNFYHFSDFN